MEDLRLLLSGKDKKRVNASLPAGVTDRDLTYFTQCQDKAKTFLTSENSGMEEEPSVSTPKALHHTPLPKNTPQVRETRDYWIGLLSMLPFRLVEVLVV